MHEFKIFFLSCLVVSVFCFRFPSKDIASGESESSITLAQFQSDGGITHLKRTLGRVRKKHSTTSMNISMNGTSAGHSVQIANETEIASTVSDEKNQCTTNVSNTSSASGFVTLGEHNGPEVFSNSGSNCAENDALQGNVGSTASTQPSTDHEEDASHDIHTAENSYWKELWGLYIQHWELKAVVVFVFVAPFLCNVLIWQTPVHVCAENLVGIIHVLFASAMLLCAYIDRRWIVDITFDHPYDPVIPITEEPWKIRVWQQFFLFIFVLSLGVVPVLKLNCEPRTRAPILACEVLAMIALALSDLFLWHFQYLVYYAGFVSLLYSAHTMTSIWIFLRPALACMYLFGGMNKVNPIFFDQGFGFVVQELMPWVSRSQTVRIIAGCSIGCGEAACGAGLLMPGGWIQQISSVGLMLMHIGIIIIMSLKDYGYMIVPVNVVCLSCHFFMIVFPDGCHMSPIVDMKDMPHRKRVPSKMFVGVFLSVLYVLGPASYLTRTMPWWPNNSGMALSMYSFNELSFGLELGPTTYAASEERPNSIARFSSAYSFDWVGFLEQRMTIGTTVLQGGFCYGLSIRAQKQIAIWLARATGQQVTLFVTGKLPIGFRMESNQTRSKLRITCSAHEGVHGHVAVHCD